MGAKWIKISVLYLVIVMAFGLFMHYTIQLEWKSTHAHIGVVGWLTTGFIGLLYSVYKDAAETGLAKAQFWFYNIGLPFLLVGMMMVYIDVPRWLFELFVSGGGIAVAISVLFFVVNVFKNVKS
ncbi:cytochrome-c oxidase [Lysinibacillus sp. CTST325]